MGLKLYDALVRQVIHENFCRIYDKKDNQFTLNLRYIYYRLIQIIYCDKLVLIYLKNTIHNLKKKIFHLLFSK